MNLDRHFGDTAARIDQLVEALAVQQLAVNDAGRADLDDLVALGRVQPGRLGIEDRIGDLREQPIVEVAEGLAAGEQLEIVVLGPTPRGRRRQCRLGRRERQEEAEERDAADPVVFDPELSAVPLGDVAHGERQSRAARLHRFALQAAQGLGAGVPSRPGEIEACAAAGSG